MEMVAAASMRASAPMPQVVRPGTPGAEITGVTAVATSLDEFGSAESTAETVAVLPIGPNQLGAVTMMSNDAEAPLARDATVQVTVPLAFTHPASAETNTTPAGSGSEMATVVAVSGPLLVAVSV